MLAAYSSELSGLSDHRVLFLTDQAGFALFFSSSLYLRVQIHKVNPLWPSCISSLPWPKN
jgi:hypothetical protein